MEAENSSSFGGETKRTEEEVVGTLLKKDEALCQQLEVEGASFNLWDVLCALISMFTLLFEQITQLVLAVYFFHHENFLYFGLTLIFVLLPAVVMNIFSFTWSIIDWKNGLSSKSRVVMAIRVLSAFCCSSMILRYIELMCEQCRVMKLKSCVRLWYKVLCDETDVALIRLVGCFLLSAPQLILQLYILVINDIEEMEEFPINSRIQVISVISSMVSFCWSMANYNRSLHLNSEDKPKVVVGTICQFMWRVCELSSRVVPLAVFASIFPFFLFVVLLVHWIIMSIWIMLQKTEFCRTRKQEMFFDLILGFTYIFCFLNVTDKPCVYKMAAYYILTLLEGSALLLTWYLLSEELEWYQVPALVSFFSLFVFGLVLTRVYYHFFHPTLSLRKDNNNKTDKKTSDSLCHVAKLSRRPRKFH